MSATKGRLSDTHEFHKYPSLDRRVLDYFNEEGPGLFAVPDYLNVLSQELVGEIMYSVTGLLDPALGASWENIESSLRQIDTPEKIKLWTRYYNEQILLDQVHQVH